MPIAPSGKYDEVAIGALTFTKADAAIILVINGKEGSGMSVASVSQSCLEILPTMLRELADAVELANTPHTKVKH